MVSSAQTFAWGTCSSLTVDEACQVCPAGVTVDIAQVSMSDSCSKCEKELTQGHMGLLVISFSHLLQLSFSHQQI